MCATFSSNIFCKINVNKRSKKIVISNIYKQQNFKKLCNNKNIQIQNTLLYETALIYELAILYLDKVQY